MPFVKPVWVSTHSLHPLADFCGKVRCSIYVDIASPTPV